MSMNEAFKKINYTGNIVVESFTKDVKVIAREAKVCKRLLDRRRGDEIY
jgi:hypothetical protein